MAVLAGWGVQGQGQGSHERARWDQVSRRDMCPVWQWWGSLMSNLLQELRETHIVLLALHRLRPPPPPAAQTPAFCPSSLQQPAGTDRVAHSQPSVWVPVPPHGPFCQSNPSMDSTLREALEPREATPRSLLPPEGGGRHKVSPSWCLSGLSLHSHTANSEGALLPQLMWEGVSGHSCQPGLHPRAVKALVKLWHHRHHKSRGPPLP